MRFAEQILPGTWIVRLNKLSDARGTFVKTYARTVFDAAGIEPFDFREEFYSSSRLGVIRGMHFQAPPHDHVKLVYCAVGAVHDVLLDLRAGANYASVAQVRLSEDDPALVYVPRGVAHGFRALVDGSLMIYKTSEEYAPSHDLGIRWDSFGHDWEIGDGAPIVSQRDALHPRLADFRSPF